jgi:4-oxalomesaconate tautomerase
VALTIGGTEAGPVVERAGLVRTARIVMDGTAFVPTSRLAVPALAEA